MYCRPFQATASDNIDGNISLASPRVTSSVAGLVVALNATLPTYNTSYTVSGKSTMRVYVLGVLCNHIVTCGHQA
jgi:hypothetical protein